MGMLAAGILAPATCLAGLEAAPAAPTATPAAETVKQDGGLPAAAGAQKPDPSYYTRQIARRGKTVIVAPGLADEVKKDNQIVLSSVAVKTRVDKNGNLAGYELFEIDKGSIPEKIGFRSGDRIIAVNGIPARNLEKNQAALQSAGRFEVTILRKGKARKIFVEIRETGKQAAGPR
jgi:membrane-associated protease RseP (regulator of RpoE activity)